ncbi:putative 1,3-beta-glucan synthase [Dioscorea sansibarensis]
MARVYERWERLVRAALDRERLRGAGATHGTGGREAAGLAGAVPPSLGKTTNIDGILHAADEIEDEDPNVARIQRVI